MAENKDYKKIMEKYIKEIEPLCLQNSPIYAPVEDIDRLLNLEDFDLTNPFTTKTDDENRIGRYSQKVFVHYCIVIALDRYNPKKELLILLSLI